MDEIIMLLYKPTQYQTTSNALVIASFYKIPAHTPMKWKGKNDVRFQKKWTKRQRVAVNNQLGSKMHITKLNELTSKHFQIAENLHGSYQVQDNVALNDAREI